MESTIEVELAVAYVNNFLIKDPLLELHDIG